MIKDDMTPFQHRVTFKDDGITRVQFTDDRRYYERLVSQHGHLTDLHITPVALRTEQQARLGEIKDKGLSGHDAGVYVRYGTTESEDTSHHNPDKLQAYFRDCCAPAIKAARKEAESSGVMLNGVRYAGDSGGRQALRDAVSAAEEAGMTVFSIWKDSDGQYHNNHPLSEVKAALAQISQRRSALIALEALYVNQVAAGEIEDSDLDWATEYD